MPHNHPPQEIPHETRISEALPSLFDFSFGTLWWVREDLWKESFSQENQPYDLASPRSAHPGVALREETQENLDIFEFVPMLYGSSNAAPVTIRFFPDSPTKRTHFGSILRPAPPPIPEFIYPAPDDDPSRLSGNLLRKKRVIANLDKPRADENEIAVLDNFLKSKNL